MTECSLYRWKSVLKWDKRKCSVLKTWHSWVTSATSVPWPDILQDKRFGKWLDGSHLKSNFRLTPALSVTVVQIAAEAVYEMDVRDSLDLSALWFLLDSCHLQLLSWCTGIQTRSFFMLTRWKRLVCWMWMPLWNSTPHGGRVGSGTCVWWVDVQESVAC